MIGIAIEVLLSFLLLKYYGHNFIDVLGLKPNNRRLLQLLMGIAFPVFFYCAFKFTVSWLVHNPYRINQDYGLTDLTVAVAFVGRAVIFEELIFRGALLYILCQKINTHKAVLLSSIVFGMYHWFAWQAFGNPVQMLIVFLTTASGGYIFGLAFVRTKSMYLSSALHFGGNLATMVVFSQDKAIGRQWLIESFHTDPVVPPFFISIPVIIVHFTGFQLLTLYLLRKINWEKT